jgi:ribonuclease J
MRAPDELVFAPLGGAGEIGMNLAIYGLGDEQHRQWIVVDFGVAFADDALPGIDLIMPDIRYLVEERRNILGLVLTHAHEDHFGALLDLWPRLELPVYATPFTAALINAKRQGEPGAPEIPLTILPLGARFRLGPFDIELVSMAHSIPESNGLIIRTPAGTVLHTGDWKIDPTPVVGTPTDEAKLRALGNEGCLALIGDSTNAFREGRSPSEADVAACLAELIRSAPARVAVTTFASNVARLRAVAQAAAACEREVVLVGRAMERIAQVARETGYLDGVRDFRSVEIYGHLPPDKVLALCTGSQGEPRAALSRIAQDDHPEVAFSRGDRVIFSSRAIPGNEKAVTRVINGLIEQGIEVITDRTHLVHVSGHPRIQELRDMIGWVRPQMLIPVHGEPLHMAEHAEVARRRQGGSLPGRRTDPPRPRRSGKDRRGAGGTALQRRLTHRQRRRAHRGRPPPARLCRDGFGRARDKRARRFVVRAASEAHRYSRNRHTRTSDRGDRLRRGSGSFRVDAAWAPARPGGGRRCGTRWRTGRPRRRLEQKAYMPCACAGSLMITNHERAVGEPKPNALLLLLPLIFPAHEQAARESVEMI